MYIIAIMKLRSLLVFIVFSGCLPIPFPHTYSDPPKFSGMLTKNGTPVIGAEVYLSSCSVECSEKVKTLTDGAGYFSFPSLRRFSFFFYVPFAPICLFDQLRLQIILPDKSEHFWSYSGLRDPNWGRPALELSCDAERSDDSCQGDSFCRVEKPDYVRDREEKRKEEICSRRKKRIKTQ